MKKNKKNKKHKEKYVISFILILMVCLGVALGYAIQTRGGGLQGVVATILGQDAETLKDLKTVNILILGKSEDIEAELTDTIMVCSYNPKKQRAAMLSIPRDTFIGTNKNRANGFDKLNSVYSKKGGEGVVQKIEEMTGIDINYYLVVNNDAVVQLVNTLGGVEFDVPIDMNYDDPTQNLHIHLKKGLQKLDGDQAEQLIRFRHNNNGTTYSSDYGDNDFGRMRTQRDFMMAVAKQTLKVQNITKIKTIMTTIFQNIETNFELEDIFPYVAYAVNFDTANIASYQVAGEAKKYNNLWFFAYNKEQTSQIIMEINNYLNAVDENTENDGNTTTDAKITIKSTK